MKNFVPLVPLKNHLSRKVTGRVELYYLCGLQKCFFLLVPLVPLKNNTVVKYVYNAVSSTTVQIFMKKIEKLKEISTEGLTLSCPMCKKAVK